ERRRRGEKGIALRAAAAARKRPATSAGDCGLREPTFDFLEKGAVRGPLRVPQTRGRVDGCRHAEAFELRPERVVVGMGEIRISAIPTTTIEPPGGRLALRVFLAPGEHPTPREGKQGGGVVAP